MRNFWYSGFNREFQREITLAEFAEFYNLSQSERDRMSVELSETGRSEYGQHLLLRKLSK